MKKTLFLLASLALAASTQAASLTIDLPTGQVVNEGYRANFTEDALKAEAAVAEYGKSTNTLWGQGNNNRIDGYPLSGEGVFSENTELGGVDVTLFGRGGVAGEIVGFTLTNAIEVGTQLEHMFFYSMGSDKGSSNVAEYNLFIGIYDTATNATIASAKAVDINLQAGGGGYAMLNFSDLEGGSLEWKDTYNIVGGIVGDGAYAATTPYTVKGLTLTAQIADAPATPEPATASLSLLGLGALMMRRRRA